MSRTTTRRLSLPLALLPLLVGACSEEHAAESSAEPAATAPDELPATAPTAASDLELPEDAELAPWRGELLGLAMDTATALPAYPHIKTQAELQQNVVQACVELDQPRRALAYTEQITNWRKGVGYAELAVWLSERGEEAGFDELVALAEVESHLEGAENPQTWQRDMIRSMLAVALFEFGRAGDAIEFERDLDDAEVGRVAASKARLLDVEDMGARLEKLEELLPVANLDQLRSALAGAIELYDRGIADEELRTRWADWISLALTRVPAQIAIEVRLDMARRAAERGNPEEAQAQVDAARAVLDSLKWLPEDHVPMIGRIAQARFVAGDVETARAEMAEALDLFHAERDTIQDFWRGGALRPLAEACVAMGDTEQALRIYRIAAEEGTSNVNARTRCMDLVANCLSMVLHDVQPDDELAERLRATYAGLEDPW